MPTTEQASPPAAHPARVARRVACALLAVGVAASASAGPAAFGPLPASAPALAASAASAPLAAASGPRVRLVAVRHASLQGREAHLDVVLQVRNPGGWRVTLNDIRFHCSFNGTATARGNSTAPLPLPPHGVADVPVRLDVDAAALLAVLAQLSPDGVVHYRLDGDAEIGDTLLRVPFHEQGSVQLGSA